MILEKKTKYFRSMKPKIYMKICKIFFCPKNVLFL